MNKTIRGAVDRRLSGLNFDERLMNRLSQRVEELDDRAPSARRGGRVLLIAALVLLLTVGALAASFFTGAVDWLGQPIRTETVEPTPVPNSLDAAAKIQEHLDDMASEKPDDEVWVITYADGSGGMHLATERIATFEEMGRRLREAGSPLELPEIPDGYRFISGQFHFYSTEEALRNYDLIATETPFKGVTVRKYRPGADSKLCISDYFLVLKDREGREMHLDASLDSLSSRREFGVTEGEEYEAISVPGMKNALYTSKKGERSLHMLKTGFLPVWFIDSSVLDPENKAHFEPEFYDAIVYDIFAESQEKEDLLTIAESLN